MPIKFSNVAEAQKRASIACKTFLPYLHDFLRVVVSECKNPVQAESIHRVQNAIYRINIDRQNASRISQDVVANVLGYKNWDACLAYHRGKIYRPYSCDEAEDVTYERLDSLRAEQAINLLEVMGKHNLCFCSMDIGHCRDFVDFWQPTAKRTDQNALTQKYCRDPRLWADETTEIRCVVDSFHIDHCLGREPQLNLDQATILKDWIHRTDDLSIQFFWDLSRRAAWNSFKSTPSAHSTRAADIVLSALAAAEDKVAMGLLAILRFGLHRPESFETAFNYAKGASSVLARFADVDATAICQVGHISAVLLSGVSTSPTSTYADWVLQWEDLWRGRTADSASCERMIREHRRWMLRRLPDSNAQPNRQQVFFFAFETSLIGDNKANLSPR